MTPPKKVAVHPWQVLKTAAATVALAALLALSLEDRSTTREIRDRVVAFRCDEICRFQIRAAVVDGFRTVGIPVSAEAVGGLGLPGTRTTGGAGGDGSDQGITPGGRGKRGPPGTPGETPSPEQPGGDGGAGNGGGQQQTPPSLGNGIGQIGQGLGTTIDSTICLLNPQAPACP